MAASRSIARCACPGTRARRIRSRAARKRGAARGGRPRALARSSRAALVRILNAMELSERIKADLADAMRAGDRERTGALRLVLSELQKAAKEGSEDEL